MQTLFAQLNRGRQHRFWEELEHLHALPMSRLESCKRFRIKVGQGSTIRVAGNLYSVHSRLIGEQIEIRLYAEHLELWYGQHCIDELPRLRGKGKHRIDYRHIIAWLVRKPGAFEHYRYRADLFPTHRFRMVYDLLYRRNQDRAGKDYLQILQLAADEGELVVDQALEHLIDRGEALTLERVKTWVVRQRIVSAGGLKRTVKIATVDLSAYDVLLLESDNEIRGVIWPQ